MEVDIIFIVEVTVIESWAAKVILDVEVFVFVEVALVVNVLKFR